MTDIFDRIVLPVASIEDAQATARALGPHETGRVVAVHVIEKAGGAPDKASVEQREEVAAEAFDVLRDALPDRSIETDLRYGTDVAETIFAAAGDHDATAIVITPRGGNRWIRLLTGDVALNLVTKTNRPVIVLPDTEHDDSGDDKGGDEGDEGADGERGDDEGGDAS
jgi:nucleotide-binding universal stress UspA family protein